MGVAGTDTLRGIGYQQAQAALTVIEALDDPVFAAVRIEGTADVVDLEILDAGGNIILGQQMKIRDHAYTWSGNEVLAVLKRWSKVAASATASFEFVTDGRLGPTGEKLRAALAAAGNGDLGPLTEFLGAAPDAALAAAAARARIRYSNGGVGALLGSAARQVGPLLPGAPTTADALEEADARVRALFTELFDAGGDPDPHARVRSREQVAQLLGVPADAPAALRWPALRQRLIDSASGADLPGLECTLNPVGSGSVALGEGLPEDRLRPLVLADRPSSDQQHRQRPVLLVGRTGAGKSTCAGQLRVLAARDGRVVLVTHSETYLSGRLAASVADAATDLLGVPVPVSTGRQMMADPSVTLVIDGVSEVPRELRDALAVELRSPVARGAGAAVVLAGRDAAVLRSVLPGSVEPVMFAVEPLQREQRVQLAGVALARLAPADDAPFPGSGAAAQRDAATLAAQVDAALGDAAGNPMLFSLGVQLVAAGMSFRDRADLYARSVELLAQRAGVTGLDAVSTVLGLVFARLLDGGRRYADQVDWAMLVHEEAARLAGLGVDIDGAQVTAAAASSGMVIPVGFAQTVVPVHDSFADFLAAQVHARGLVALPAVLDAGDDQRVLFTGEVGGVTAQLAAQVARDRPFLLPKLSPHDRRPCGDETPDEVTALLHALTGNNDAAVLYPAPDGRTVAISRADGPPRWEPWPAGGLIEVAAAARAAGSGRGADVSVVAADAGPISVADALWQAHLRKVFGAVSDEEAAACGAPAAPRHPPTLAAARDSLEQHAMRTRQLVHDLLDQCAPPAGRDQLAAAVGPAGIAAEIFNERDHHFGPSWPVHYRRTAEVTVRAVDAPEPDHRRAVLTEQASGSVDYMLDKSPAQTALAIVTDGLRRLTRRDWL
jgi:hypothetical protein